jgi:hypothetical protein
VFSMKNFIAQRANRSRAGTEPFSRRREAGARSIGDHTQTADHLVLLARRGVPRPPSIMEVRIRGREML